MANSDQSEKIRTMFQNLADEITKMNGSLLIVAAIPAEEDEMGVSIKIKGDFSTLTATLSHSMSTDSYVEKLIMRSAVKFLCIRANEV